MVLTGGWWLRQQSPVGDLSAAGARGTSTPTKELDSRVRGGTRPQVPKDLVELPGRGQTNVKTMAAIPAVANVETDPEKVT